MRLLIVSSEFPPGPGGIGTHACQIARCLHAVGWDVAVATSQHYADAAAIRRFNIMEPFRITTLQDRPGVVDTLVREESGTR